MRTDSDTTEKLKKTQDGNLLRNNKSVTHTEKRPPPTPPLPTHICEHSSKAAAPLKKMAVCRPKRSGFLGDEQYNYSDIIGWKGGIYSNIKKANPKGKKLGQDRCLAKRRRRRKLAVNFSRLLAGDLADSRRAFASTPVTLSEPVLGQTACLFLSASCHGVSVCTVIQKIIHNPPWAKQAGTQ